MSRSGLHTFARKYSTALQTRVGDWGDFASAPLAIWTLIGRLFGGCVP